MRNMTSIQDHLLQKAMKIMYNLELILDDIYSGNLDDDELNKVLDESCKDLEKIRERLNLEYGKRAK